MMLFVQRLVLLSVLLATFGQTNAQVDTSRKVETTTIKATASLETGRPFLVIYKLVQENNIVSYDIAPAGVPVFLQTVSSDSIVLVISSLGFESDSKVFTTKEIRNGVAEFKTVLLKDAFELETVVIQSAYPSMTVRGDTITCCSTVRNSMRANRIYY